VLKIAKICDSGVVPTISHITPQCTPKIYYVSRNLFSKIRKVFHRLFEGGLGDLEKWWERVEEGWNIEYRTGK